MHAGWGLNGFPMEVRPSRGYGSGMPSHSISGLIDLKGEEVAITRHGQPAGLSSTLVGRMRDEVSRMRDEDWR